MAAKPKAKAKVKAKAKPKPKVRTTDDPNMEYGRIGRTKRLLLAALRVWELKNYGRALPD